MGFGDILMFQDARDIPTGASLTFDVCIIGGGAAGITLANELSSHCRSIALLEAGGMRSHAATQALYDGDVANPLRHGPLSKYRRRCLGGTTVVWGGRCAPFDDIDFEERSYVSNSGWPIDRKDLEPYYHRAHDYLDLGDFSYSMGGGCTQNLKPLIPGLQAPEVSDDFLWRFSPPTNFAKKYCAKLKTDPNVTLFLHANCLKLVTNTEGNIVLYAETCSLLLNKFKVRARQFVLAAGGLEITRLLLASKDHHSNGIGNGNDLVGRFYLSHIAGSVGPLHLTPHGKGITHTYQKSSDNIYCRPALAIKDNAQRSHGLLNFRATLTHPPPEDPRHCSSVWSAMYLLKWCLSGKISPEFNKALASAQYRNILLHLRNIIADFPSLMSFAPIWIGKRIMSRRKLPSVELKSNNNTYYLHYDSEQSPNYHSRVTLADKRDSLGVRRLSVDWKYSNGDIESALRSIYIVNAAFSRACVGTILARHEELVDIISEQVHVGSHHIGLTRMGITAKQGVVDSNCRVFETNNLYIASSSVFPTSSFANPTLTIVALAIRLGDHLRSITTR
jgi:choline dehydrogenase-like flavoprotein